MKTRHVYAICTAILAVLFSTASAAKVGDKGKGWKVVEDADGFLRCKYNGNFRLQGAIRQFNTATGTTKCPTPRPFIKYSGGGKKVSLGQGTNDVWRVKTARGSGLETTIRARKNKKYLSPLTDVQTAEWNTDVAMGLRKKKSSYRIRPGGDLNDIDCLNDVDLISAIGTSISYDCASEEFRYDSDESYWNLIPM